MITFVAPTILCASVLGLRSTHTESVPVRWERFKRKLGWRRQTASAPAKSHSANAVTVDPVQHAQKPSAASKRERKSFVHQTGDGIRVSPAALNKHKRPNKRDL